MINEQDPGKQELIDQIESYIDDLQLVLKLYRKFGRKQDAIADMNGIGKDLIGECLPDYEYGDH